MCNDEGRAPTAQRVEPVLNHRLALTVEARRSFVQDEDARVCENGTSYRYPLALTTRELDASLTDDRGISVLEAVDKVVCMRDLADLLDLLGSGVWFAELDVLSDGAVKQEILLHDHAQGTPIVPEPHLAQIITIHQHAPRLRSIERHHEANNGALTRSAGTNQSGG